MPRLRAAMRGSVLKNSPTGFPLYVVKRQPRVVTADVWAFFQNAISSQLKSRPQRQALVFLEQASEFFITAQSPHLSVRPLLYYYSFLNLTKAFLLVKRVALAPACKHGISNPQENRRIRVRLEGQSVRFPKCAANHSELFPEFITALGYTVRKPKTIKVISLLRQVPAIHRTFSKVTREHPSFLPIERFELVKANHNICVRMVLQRNDKDVKMVLRTIRSRRAFRNVFEQVSSCNRNNNELWFETRTEKGVGRGVDTAIQTLAKRIRELGVWSILTASGWKYYLSSVPPRETLPQLASVYATMFYLGSITRYQPYDFDKIFSGKYAWLISEFLQTQPTQFFYGLAGYIAGTDVVRPFAVIHV